MLRDHQLFEERKLANGITLYCYQDRFRIAHLEIQFPVGSGHAHAGNGWLPGSVHFLEHTQLIRSQKFPRAYSVDELIGLKGGHSNGTTYASATTHWMNVPAIAAATAQAGFLDQIFHPVFHDDDLLAEREVIKNERNQRKFYPGDTPASQYFYTQFIQDQFYPLEQIFGSDTDLEAQNADSLAKQHQQISSSPDIRVLAVGPTNHRELENYLSTLPTSPQSLNTRIAPTTWAKREFHTVFFDTIPQPTLRVAWIHPRFTYAEAEAVSFILSLLINSTHGTLYREFREEKGWLYSIGAFSSLREHSSLIGLSFPVNNLQQVEYIRSCLAERIRQSILDQQLVEREISRHLGNQVYNFQTAGEIISTASQELLNYGHIHTEKESRLALERMADLAWRQEIIDSYFRASDMGSICFMPERRRLRPIREIGAIHEVTHS